MELSIDFLYDFVDIGVLFVNPADFCAFVSTLLHFMECEVGEMVSDVFVFIVLFYSDEIVFSFFYNLLTIVLKCL